MKKIFVIFTALICTLPSMVCAREKSDYYYQKKFEETYGTDENEARKIYEQRQQEHKKLEDEYFAQFERDDNQKSSEADADKKGQESKEKSEEKKEKSKKKKTDSNATAVFGNIDIPDPLFRAMSSKNVSPEALCKSKPGLATDKGDYDDDCAYINPYFGICDTHVYNIGGPENPTNSDDIEKMQQVIAVKTTVLSQQMYKQYEYLAATLRRLKTQLEKSVLNAELEMLGANSDKSSNSVYGKNSNYSECSTGDQNSSLWCLRQNYSALLNQVNNGTCGRDEKKQIAKDLKLIKSWLNLGDDDCFDESKISSRDKCRECLNNVYQVDLIKLQRDIEDSEYKRKMLYH